MQNEEIQEIYSQLQKLKFVDFTNNKKANPNPYKQQLQEIIKKTLSSPEETSRKICQYIVDGGLKNIKGFDSSIFRMLQTGQLNQKGLEQIIRTIKDKYQIE